MADTKVVKPKAGRPRKNKDPEKLPEPSSQVKFRNPKLKQLDEPISTYTELADAYDKPFPPGKFTDFEIKLFNGTLDPTDYKTNEPDDLNALCKYYFLVEDYAKEIEYAYELFKQDKVRGYFRIGHAYYNINKGEYNQEIVELYIKAAELKNVDAAINLAFYYQDEKKYSLSCLYMFLAYSMIQSDMLIMSIIWNLYRSQNFVCKLILLNMFIIRAVEVHELEKYRPYYMIIMERDEEYNRAHGVTNPDLRAVNEYKETLSKYFCKLMGKVVNNFNFLLDIFQEPDHPLPMPGPHIDSANPVNLRIMNALFS